MKKLTKEQFEEFKNKASIIKGIYAASKERLALNNEVRAGDIRRYDNYLNKIREITDDNEFINFSASLMTSWSNDAMVDGTEFNSVLNQFFQYVMAVYNLDGERENIKTKNWVYYTNPFWFLWKLTVFVWRHKIISFIILIIGLIATDYSMAWRNINIIWRLIKSILKIP